MKKISGLVLTLCILQQVTAGAADLKSFRMTSDASLAFAKLFFEHELELIDSSCEVSVDRPEASSSEPTLNPASGVRCSIQARQRILLQDLEISFESSPVFSWGGAGENSFTVKGSFAQKLWSKLHMALWSEFNGRTDGSIYFPIISCAYSAEDQAIGECTELYTIDRKISSETRSQVICGRKTRLEPGALGLAPGYDPHNPALVQRKLLSEVLSRQVAKGERAVQNHFCIFMD